MKFELLPNELLIECLKYFDVLEIFYSFDQLNTRFNALIRSMPLHFNFRDAEKPRFDQFCQEMRINPQIQQRIHSLHLFNENPRISLEKFLSDFPLDQFIQLRSLTLNEINRNIRNQFESILPSIHYLCCLDINEQGQETLDPFLNLSHTKLRTLSIPTPGLSITRYLMYPSSLRNLIVQTGNLYVICQMLNDVPTLYSLRINVLKAPRCPNTYMNCHIQLKRLFILNCECNFEQIESLLKCTPNLKCLTLFSKYHDDFIDANRWEDFIRSSLVQLTDFKFVFVNHHRDDSLVKFQRFQNSFWHEREWYTEYVSWDDSIQIYTIPYMSKFYTLKAYSIRKCNAFQKESNIFKNVKSLYLSGDALGGKSGFYFPNVTSLEIEYQSDKSARSFSYIESIKKNIDLSILKHLHIRKNEQMNISVVLLEIFREALVLSSLTIAPKTLLLFQNEELCQYLNKMIKKVELYHFECLPYEIFDQIKRFCQLFSNIEQLICYIHETDHLLHLLKHLSKLSYLQIRDSLFADANSCSSWFEKQSLELNITFDLTNQSFSKKRLHIWISRNDIL